VSNYAPVLQEKRLELLREIVPKGALIGQLRLPALAADLVQRKVKVIVTGQGRAPEAAKLATTAIPIVVNMAGDPVRLGFVASLTYGRRHWQH
jgi:ABC-type uncharacterized transport system substrate-binding protein